MRKRVYNQVNKAWNEAWRLLGVPPILYRTAEVRQPWRTCWKVQEQIQYGIIARAYSTSKGTPTCSLFACLKQSVHFSNLCVPVAYLKSIFCSPANDILKKSSFCLAKLLFLRKQDCFYGQIAQFSSKWGTFCVKIRNWPAKQWKIIIFMVKSPNFYQNEVLFE